MATKAQQAAEQKAKNEYANGVSAAQDIMWRFQRKTDFPEGGISDEVIKATAWALSEFQYTTNFMDGLLDTLKLKWEEQPMGGFSLVRKS